MSQIFKVGIVGSGFGTKAHLPALTAHKRFEVIALASPHSAKAIAAERKVSHAFASCKEMLDAIGDELDCVVIAAPPFLHHEDILTTLERKLHVLCEKPFALNLAQAEEMVRAAERAGTACGISHEFRWIPQRIAIKQLIQNGHLAPMREIEITQLSGNLRTSGTRQRGWWFEKERGGGLAGALLSHLIDSANNLAGRPPVRSTGFIRTANPQRHDENGAFTSTVDDGAFAMLDYGDGLIALLTVDGTCAVNQFTLSAHAENRTAVASGATPDALKLFSVDDEETNELNCKPSPYTKFATVGPLIPWLMELYDEWVKQIETGTSALPTFQEALVTQRVLESVGYST